MVTDEERERLVQGKVGLIHCLVYTPELNPDDFGTDYWEDVVRAGGVQVEGILVKKPCMISHGDRVQVSRVVRDEIKVRHINRILEDLSKGPSIKDWSKE